jgi:hypothetical protein
MRIIVLFFVVVLASQLFGQQPVQAEDNAVVAANCNMCHSISALGVEKKNPKMQTPDLSNVGKYHDQEFLKKYLAKEIAHTGHEGSDSTKMHPTKVADAQKLEAVSAQLAGLGK